MIGAVITKITIEKIIQRKTWSCYANLVIKSTTKMIVNVDARALEWLTYLYLSQDSNGIEEWHEVYNNPGKYDIHRNNQEAFNLPSRLIAKVFLFRFIYRGSAYAYSMDPDFRPVSTKVAFWEDVIDRYYTKYKGIYEIHMKYIRDATTTGRIVSPFGRAYTFTPKERRGELVWSESDIVNWPNQGLGADVMAVARIAVRQRMKRAGLQSKLNTTVHDSIAADCPDNEVQDVAALFNNTFRALPNLITQAYGVEWNVPLLGEVSVGENMLEMTEVKF
jgi:DNA polymerase I-like protein with 3'-5' exonuclease and polymerase domains